jgi:predicted ATPase
VLQVAELPPPGEVFPFTLPLLRGCRSLDLAAPVTVLVGENGSGKSTLLEALAWACDLPVAGSVQDVGADATLPHARSLGRAMKLTWTARSKRGLFFRAEDYFGFVKAQNRMKAEMRRDLERLRQERPHLPEGELRRIGAPYAGAIAATEARYGPDLDAASHGESFLAFFKGRIRGAGLYVLDEPEAALSSLRQLAFLSLLKEATARGAQVILATHAPILMAFPGAKLYEISEDRVVTKAFDDLEHVRLLRAFLQAPDGYLRHL